MLEFCFLAHFCSFCCLLLLTPFLYCYNIFSDMNSLKNHPIRAHFPCASVFPPLVIGPPYSLRPHPQQCTNTAHPRATQPASPPHCPASRTAPPPSNHQPVKVHSYQSPATLFFNCATAPAAHPPARTWHHVVIRSTQVATCDCFFWHNSIHAP
jgi:hypothetical protein